MAFLSPFPLHVIRPHSTPPRSHPPRLQIRKLHRLTSSLTQHDNPIQPPDETPIPALANKTSNLDVRVLFGEFLSTFLFVYLSVNSAAAATPLDSLNNGAIIAALAASFIPVSGAHLNPAVTLALAVTNRVPIPRALAFIPIQMAASVAACLLTKSLAVPVPFQGIAAAASSATLLRAFFAEFMPMLIIVVVIFQTAVATEREGGVGIKLAALYIGLTVLACAGSFSAGVFNPARAFGPALVSGNLASHWIFWVGPMAGAAIAAFMCEHFFLAPAGDREPNSWIADLLRKSSNLGQKVKTLGLAGAIAYGVMDFFYYGIAFPFFMLKIGIAGGAASVAKAWVLTWSLSQVTKPIRLGVTLVLAPIINRIFQARAEAKKRKT